MTAKYSVTAHLDHLNQIIKILKFYRGLIESQKSFLSNAVLQDAVAHRLHLAVEAMMNIGELTIVQKGFHKPGSPQEIFDILADERVIPKKLANRLVGSVNFRNILVHDYITVDQKRVFEVLQKGIKDLSAFARQVALGLTKSEKGI